MEQIKKIILMYKIYFSVRQLKKWIRTCKDPLKLMMIEGMYNLIVEPYNAVMPKFIKRIEVTGSKNSISDIKKMAKNYQPDISIDA